MNILSLVTFTALPYPSAEGVHMAMLADALSKVSDFELVSPIKVWRPTTLSKKLEMFGVDVGRLSHKKFLELKPMSTYFLRTILSNNPNHVYYCRQSYAADYFLKRGRLVMWEVHGLPTEGQFEFLSRAFPSSLFKGLVVITEALKLDILKMIGNRFADQIHVLPDGADVERFSYTSSSTLPSRLRVGYVGSNYKGKGWEIIEKLPEKCQSNFHIYGFEYAENTASNAKYYGKIPFSQIPDAYKTFDIGLLPNQPDVIMRGGDNIGKYTSPMKLFEYMAAGKVIIASDLPVIREVLEHRRNALLVPHDDVEAWLNAINELNDDRELFNALKEQAYTDVCERYSYMARAERIVRLANI